jgi:hypothetical protein
LCNSTLKPNLLSQIILDVWTIKIDPDDLQKQLEVYKKRGGIDTTFDVKSMNVRGSLLKREQIAAELDNAKRP